VSIVISKEKLLRALGLDPDTFAEALLKTVAPTREKTEKILDTYVIDPNTAVEHAVTCTENYSAIVLTVRVEYHPLATGGLRVIWLYSQDGENYDTIEDAVEEMHFVDVSFAPGEARQRTTLIPLLTNYVKLVFINTDVNVPVVVSAWITFFR
jgi:hypothetical protein